MYFDSMESFTILFLLCFFIPVNVAQLVINVQNQGGEIIEETVAANVSENIIVLEFQSGDGTLVTQLIDFDKKIQIFRAVVLGEEERGQSQYQVMCFVIHANPEDFVAPEALKKLKQKNPDQVRIAEIDYGTKNISLPVKLQVKSHHSRTARNSNGRFPELLLSKHISSLCSEAADNTYTSNEFSFWDSKLTDVTNGKAKMNAIKSMKKLSNYSNCVDRNKMWEDCICHLELNIPWYPCGLKFCKIKSSTSDLHKCGIKTCRRSFRFSYYVKHKQLCLWDE